MSQGKSSPRFVTLVTSSLSLRRGIAVKVRNNFVTRWGSISCFFQCIKIRTTVTGYHCKLMNINNLSITIRCPRVSRSSSCPECAIQRPILDCLRNVSRFDGFGSREVGHRARNLENAVVGARAEPLLHHGPLQQVLGVSTQFAVFPDLAGAYLSIGVNAFTLRTKAHQLDIAGADHPRTDVRGTFRHNPAPQLPIIYRRYVDVDVNAIQQRARNL